MQHVRLPPDAAARVEAGYPVVLRDWLGGRQRLTLAGEAVALVDSRGQFLASAFGDSDERVAYRIFSRQERDRLDQDWMAAALTRAATLRRGFIDPAVTDAYRLVHAEADGLPGLAVDVYGPFLLVQVYSSGVSAFLQPFLEVLQQVHHPEGIYLTDRASGPDASRKTESRARKVRGENTPPAFTVREAGVRFVVDLGGGYNTGLFLDNRENRLALRRHVRGRRVLNLFCYTASISVHAALAGAASVHSVDTSARILDWAGRNFAENGVSPDDHPLIHADALEYLRKGSHRGSLYDVIVLDPPSFSTSKKNVFSAAKDYPSLVSLAIEVLSPGGTLVCASNHHKTPSERFLADIAAVARRQRRPMKLLEFHGAGPDFPIELAYPEGQYLKFAVLSG